MEGEGRVSWMKCGSLLSLLVLLLALWFRSPQDAVLDDRLDTVLSSLLRAERKVGINSVARPKVAIGKCKCCQLANVNSLPQGFPISSRHEHPLFLWTLACQMSLFINKTITLLSLFIMYTYCVSTTGWCWCEET